MGAFFWFPEAGRGVRSLKKLMYWCRDLKEREVKMNKFLVLAVLLALAVGVQAADIVWKGSALGSGDGTSWDDGDNWLTGVPLATSTTIVNGTLFGNPITTVPMVNSAVVAPKVVIVGRNSSGRLDFSGAGRMVCVALFTRLGQNVGAVGVLNMTDKSYMVTAKLQVGYNVAAESAGGSGVVSLSGNATLHAGALTFGQEMADYDAGNTALDGTGQIIMDGSALFFVNGDQTETGFIADGWIKALGIGDSVTARYNAAGDYTEYSVLSGTEY